MNRLAVVALVGCLVVAGCLASPETGPAPNSPGATEPGGTASAPPAGGTSPHASSATSTTDGGVSVEYVVRAGSIADDVAHVYVDFAVYLAERPEDVYACTDDAPLLDDEYDPTPTPLPTAAGQCERFDVPRVDVATLDATQSLGRFDAGPTMVGGHTLVAHDVTVVLENGTTASDVYDTDVRAVTERETPSGTYGVEIGVTDYEGSNRSLRWRYGVDVERFDPAGE